MSLPAKDAATVLGVDAPLAGADLGAVLPAAGTIDLVQSLYAKDSWPDGSVLFTNEDGTFKGIWQNNQLVVTRGAATVKSLATEPNGWPGNIAIPLAVSYGPQGLELYVDGARVGYDPTVGLAPGNHLILGPATTPIRYQWIRVSNVCRDRREILSAAFGQPVITGETPYERLQPLGTALSPTTRDEGVGQTGPGKGSAVFEPTVIRNPFGPGWLMFYSGGGYPYGSTMSYVTLLATADTPAGPWNRKGVIVGNNHGGEIGHAVRNSAYVEGGVLYLFYASTDEANADLKCITTRDLTTWTAPVLVMSATATVGSNGIANTCLVKSGAGYVLYHENHQAVGSWALMASTGTSPLGPFTGTQPVKGVVVPLNGRPDVTGIAGGPWVWGDADGTWHMLYHGSWRGTTLPSLLMHATSTDGVNFTRSAYNPIVPWLARIADQDQMADPCIVEDGGKVYLFFDVDSNTGGYTAQIECMSWTGTLHDLFTIGGTVTPPPVPVPAPTPTPGPAPTGLIPAGTYTYTMSGPGGKQTITITVTNG